MMHARAPWLWLGLGVALASVGCGTDPRARTSGPPHAGDAGPVGRDLPDDAEPRDSGAFDAGAADAGPQGTGPADAAPGEGGLADAGGDDAGATEAGAGDGHVPESGDGGGRDTGATDAALSDPTGGCVSGAAGTHVVRFRWNGTPSGGSAWVSYEANTLPDLSRWHVGAYSRSIGYTPVFRDPFLGEGGLELSGSVFMDVELSTLGLGSVRNVTLAIYGRSYNTTTSGSFRWMSFSGSGASPYGGVSNSAPYEWYGADATSALPAGDDGTLLRIEAGGPSNALVVSRVELCFEAA